MPPEIRFHGFLVPCSHVTYMVTWLAFGNMADFWMEEHEEELVMIWQEWPCLYNPSRNTHTSSWNGCLLMYCLRHEWRWVRHLVQQPLMASQPPFSALAPLSPPQEQAEHQNCWSSLPFLQVMCSVWLFSSLCITQQREITCSCCDC